MTDYSERLQVGPVTEAWSCAVCLIGTQPLSRDCGGGQVPQQTCGLGTSEKQVGIRGEKEAHRLQPDVQTEHYPELLNLGTLKMHRWQPPDFLRASSAGCGKRLPCCLECEELTLCYSRFPARNPAHDILET